jgi:N-acetylmuramate 1-kinase
MSELSNMQPPEGVEEFLELNGWGGSRIEPVAGDASFRRYFRALNGNRKAILMDAPPPHEDPKPFIDIADYLCGHGFRAPQIFARDLSRGLVLLEDFGDVQMREYLDHNPGDENKVYTKAIDALVRLADTPLADLPPYDEAVYLREVRLLSEWYMPALRLPVDLAAYDGMWSELLAPIANGYRKPVTVLRDYHAENIMLLDDGDQGIIDFQDALIGHPAYDLVSLLQDARRDVSPELETKMLAYYRQAIDVDDMFDLHYALLGAQRNTKIIGIFTRLWKRDGKARYLDFLPRMWGLLERDLEHPGLAILKQWFDENIPHSVRTKSPLEVIKA